MKRKRKIYKSILSFCLAVMLTLQVVPLNAMEPVQEHAANSIAEDISAAGEPQSQESSEAGGESKPAGENALAAEAAEETETSGTDIPDSESAVQEKPKVEVPELEIPEMESSELEGLELEELELEEDELKLLDEKNVLADEIPVIGTFAIGDKTEVVKSANPSFQLVVEQESKTIPESGIINGRSNFTIKLTDIWIPVMGDRTGSDGSDIIQKGDTVVLSKADYFPDVNLTATGNSDIKIGADKIATATFAADKITILFNGNDIFFGGGKKEVKISLNVTAKAEDQAPGVNKDTSIFGHSYKLQNAGLEAQYSIVLTCNNPSGHYSWINASAFREGAIEWKAVVTAVDKSDPTIQMPLDGMVFSDALEGVGNYVGDSFKVSKVKVIGGQDQPSIDVTDAIPTIGGDDLSYTFPNDFGEYKAVITFKTWIPKDKYYYEYDNGNGGLISTGTSAHQAVVNTARLLDMDGSAEIAKSGTVTGALTPEWIQQYGKVNKSGDDVFITWTIDVNKRNHHRADAPRTDLKNVTIEDVLPAGTEFVSATYKVNNVDKGAISHVGNAFNIGDADGLIQLVIVTKVTDNSKTSFTNTPTAKWSLDQGNSNGQNNDNGVAATTTVTIGAHAFSKSVSANAEDLSLGAVAWTVNLGLQYDLAEPVVYDVLVHGGDLNVLDSVDSNPEITQGILSKIKGQVDAKQLWQQYRQGTLTSGSGLTLKHIPLTKNGEPVADLIKVSGFKGEVNASFSFRSVRTNSDILFRQAASENSTIGNRALLFDGEDYQARAEISGNLYARMLNKEMLYASQPVDVNGNPLTAPQWNRSASWGYAVPNDKNWYTSYNHNDNYILAAYNRADKTVTFRLAVNMAGYNTEAMKIDGGNRVVSDIKLVDTLPTGWEFIPFDDTGKFFELYKGAASNSAAGQLYQRADNLLDPSGLVTFTQSGNIGTFSFSKLESPYVILVKARPTNEALTTYNLGNNRVENKAEFSMKWGDSLKSATEIHPIIVPIQSLGKTVKKPVSGVQEWTVNYTPPFHMKQGVYLQDTLSAGLKLRKDIDGSLSLAPSDLAVYKGSLKPDGTLERIGDPLNLKDPNCEVKVSVEWGDSASPTKLKFEMDDPNQMYQLVYQTESKGMAAGTNAGNKIELLGDDELPPISAQSSIALDGNDVSGNATDNGLFYLKKVDPKGNPLPGVKFELFNPDGTPAENTNGSEIGEKVTDAGGKTNFIIQTPGLYQLKQTYIDENTYLPTTTIYWVRVIDAPGCPVLVDGKSVTSAEPLVVPTPATGKLTIDNTVEGNGADANKEFEYTITFDGEGKNDSYSYTKPDGSKGTIKSGDKIILKHGEKAELPRLLEGLSYSVVQRDYTGDEYTTVPTTLMHMGTIAQDGDHKAEFVNMRMLVGDLLIKNKVEGNAGDLNKEFEYTITFGGPGEVGTYAYAKSDGSSGTISSGDKIKLKHGQSITIKDILKDTTYTVAETDYTSEDYTTQPASLMRTGTIIEKQTAEAPFVNARYLPGSLLISNTVAGSGGDKSKEFMYTITFSDGNSYPYEKTGGNTGSIASGSTFALGHGEAIVIKDIPKDVSYTIIQNNYKADAYSTDPADLKRTGVIISGVQAEAHFVNSRQLPGTLELKTKPADDPGEPNYLSKVPGDGKHPALLIATLVDENGKPVEGATVTFHDKDGTAIGTAVTDKNGKVQYSWIPPKVVQTSQEVHPFTATTTATSPSGVPYKKSNEVKVIATPAELFGILRDNNTGRIIPNAEIKVRNEKTGETVTIKTDENGEYRYPVNRDEEYTITYFKMVNIGGVPTPIPFTQKADTNDLASMEGQEVPADITAVGIVLFKQPNKQTAKLSSGLIGKMKVYLKDEAGNYVKENGMPKAFPLDPTHGTFAAVGLSEQTYTMEVRYELEPGKELTVATAKLDVKADGELNISEELVDPYGEITDKETGEVIEGAEVTLYYADTQRNRDKGITPDTKVYLPGIPGFAPNDNLSPSQYSDSAGLYAYMVFPDTDYYLVVTKSGYVTYTSETISVGSDIVRYDIQMTKEKAGEGSGDNDSSGENNGSGGNNTNTSGEGSARENATVNPVAGSKETPRTGDESIDTAAILGIVGLTLLLAVLFILDLRLRRRKDRIS